MSGEPDRGTVKVVDGRYKPTGKFHYPEPNTPMWNEDGSLAGVTNPRDIVHMHSYGGEAPFFENLSKGKLMATKCENSECTANGSIFQPFRIFCPDCLSRNTIIDMTEKAKTSSKVHTFMVTERTGAFNPLPTPIKFINVEWEGVCTILMGYLCMGDPVIGMEVVPIFNTKAPTYTILDLWWVPKGTTEDQLPENFTF
jgi:uncharacterized OB-fold protein